MSINSGMIVDPNSALNGSIGSLSLVMRDDCVSLLSGCINKELMNSSLAGGFFLLAYVALIIVDVFRRC